MAWLQNTPTWCLITARWKSKMAMAKFVGWYTSWDGWTTGIHRIFAISTGAGFFPSCDLRMNALYIQWGLFVLILDMADKMAGWRVHKLIASAMVLHMYNIVQLKRAYRNALYTQNLAFGMLQLISFTEAVGFTRSIWHNSSTTSTMSSHPSGRLGPQKFSSSGDSVWVTCDAFVETRFSLAWCHHII